MAKQSGLAQAFYVGGYDLSGDVSAINTCAVRKAALDVTAIDNSAHERIGGRGDGEISFNTWFDDASGYEHTALKGLPTTHVVVCWLLSTTAGDEAACMSAKQITYNWNLGEDGSLAGTVQCLSDGTFIDETDDSIDLGCPLEWCEILVAKKTHASAADEVGILADGEAQTAYGAVGYLQHFVATSGTVEYDIEDSANSTDGSDGDWTNLMAFQDVADPWAAYAERKQVTGAVEKYVRASTNGVFENTQFSMCFRRGTAQDDLDLS